MAGLNSFTGKNRYVTPYLKRLLCNTLIQPHFDYACSAWYPKLNKKFSSKLQTSSNINEVIWAVLNSLFFLRKDFARTKSTKSTKSTKRHKDIRAKAQNAKK